MIKSKHLRPIPFKLMLRITFLPEGLSDHDYEQEVRKLVRTQLPYLQEDMESPSFMEVYDERVSAIIEEELARN